MVVSPTFNIGDLTPHLEEEDDADDMRATHKQEGEDKVNSMPISVQESSQVLLSTQKLCHKGLGPYTNLELQFKVHPKPLGSVTLCFGKVKRPPKGFNH